jgi:hypothetical protein
MKVTVGVVAIVALVVLAAPLRAHHGFNAEFDISKPLTITGAVTKVDWRNPHAWFYVDGKNDDGTVTNWGFEMASPNALMRQGWTPTSLKIGATVTVEAAPARDGSHVGSARNVILLSTGQRLFAGTAGDTAK